MKFAPFRGFSVGEVILEVVWLDTIMIEDTVWQCTLIDERTKQSAEAA